jgi:hypothetical protein
MIKAKPIVPEKYWILRDQQGKVGQVEAQEQGYRVRINDKHVAVGSIPQITKTFNVEFDAPLPQRKKTTPTAVNGYPADGPAHNGVYDIKHKLPLYTKKPNSKSWYAAGWYMVRHGTRWKPEFCPKLIALQRYKYVGPMMTQQELTLS